MGTTARARGQPVVKVEDSASPMRIKLEVQEDSILTTPMRSTLDATTIKRLVLTTLAQIEQERKTGSMISLDEVMEAVNEKHGAEGYISMWSVHRALDCLSQTGSVLQKSMALPTDLQSVEEADEGEFEDRDGELFVIEYGFGLSAEIRRQWKALNRTNPRAVSVAIETIINASPTFDPAEQENAGRKRVTRRASFDLEVTERPKRNRKPAEKVRVDEIRVPNKLKRTSDDAQASASKKRRRSTVSVDITSPNKRKRSASDPGVITTTARRHSTGATDATSKRTRKGRAPKKAGQVTPPPSPSKRVQRGVPTSKTPTQRRSSVGSIRPVAVLADSASEVPRTIDASITAAVEQNHPEAFWKFCTVL
ncbi:hypothetical protein HDU85_000050 [Gaertneriomyces sp. JEL0708]|nr:hypothetical protein HDU85_000050 [Gaertneriomyces sp. JEL0708]